MLFNMVYKYYLVMSDYLDKQESRVVEIINQSESTKDCIGILHRYTRILL